MDPENLEEAAEALETAAEAIEEVADEIPPTSSVADDSIVAVAVTAALAAEQTEENAEAIEEIQNELENHEEHDKWQATRITELEAENRAIREQLDSMQADLSILRSLQESQPTPQEPEVVVTEALPLESTDSERTDSQPKSEEENPVVAVAEAVEAIAETPVLKIRFL